MTIAPLLSSRSTRRTTARLAGVAAITIALQLAVACASANGTHDPSRRPSSRGSALGIVEVTRGDLSAASTGSSLYNAIRYLRPRLLETRAADREIPTPVSGAVYVNGVRLGDFEILMSIPSDRVRKVEFLPADGRRPYGFRYEPGAILVTLIADRP